MGAVLGKQDPQQVPTPSGHCMQSEFTWHSVPLMHAPWYATMTFTHIASQLFE
jgi:hypothetical protein